MNKKEFENWMQKQIEGVSLEGCFIDPSKDYRRELNQFRVNGHGDLLINRFGRWECLIERDRLTESDWIAHIRQKAYIKDYGAFICAYMKALEIAGVRSLNIAIYGFDSACKYADGT